MLFFMIVVGIVILRLRSNHLNLQVVRTESFSETIVEAVINNQVSTPLHNIDLDETPPPYIIAVNLPETKSKAQKQFEAPPPSYEKIHIVQCHV